MGYKKPPKEPFCRWCGKSMAESRGRLFCSRECRSLYMNDIKSDNGLAMARKELPERSQYRKPQMSIAEVQRKARELGISYGVYVQKYGG